MSGELEGRLRALVGRVDPVPAWVDEGARAAFGWRTLDADLAWLLRDSADEAVEAGVRGPGGARQLSFESGELGIELEVVATGPRARRVDGQLLPPSAATVTVERPDADAVSVQADELGRFVVDGLRAGVVRLHVLLGGGARVAVPWTSI
jgi:hypothetical protein